MATKKPAKTTVAKAEAPVAKAPAAKKTCAKKACECTAEAPVAKAPAKKACAKKACECTTEAPAKATKAPAAKKAPAPKGTRVTFSVRAEVGSKVFVAGSFNNWDATAKQLEDKKGTGLYTAVVVLPKGTHEYKFVIDGAWCADPECKDWVQNDVGSYNSVKIVE
jgi:hypothetical protein